MSSLLLAAAAAAANPSPTITAEQALANAKAVYDATPPKRATTCPQTTGDEIVVCAELEDPATQHVPSDVDQGDPDDGVTRAPDVSGLPSCAAATVCSRVGKTPVHPLIIDLKAIPEPPAGSDADKIARGEKAAP